MKDNLSEKREQELSDRFDLGVRAGRDEEEERVFRAYNFIRERLHSRHVPEIDRTALSESMAGATEYRRRRFREWRPFLRHMPRPVFAGVCLVFILMGLFGLGYSLSNPNPVTQVEFFSESVNDSETPSWFWTYRLQRGSLVTVPAQVTAKFYLSEGSIISCSPQTRIGIHVGMNRDIILHSGTVTVHAADIKNSTMTVHTPVVDVAVVGTVFEVDLIESRASAAKVTVQTGHVLLIKGTQRQMLSAGQQAIVNFDRIALVEPKPTPRTSKPAVALSSPPRTTPTVSAEAVVETVLAEEENHEPSPALPLKVVLRGKVIDRTTSLPVASADITLNSPDRQPKPGDVDINGKTETDGSFVLRGIPEGTYNIVVDAPSYVPYNPKENYRNPDRLCPLKIDQDTSNTEIIIKLDPGHAARIRVFGPHKKPEAEAIINTYISGYNDIARWTWTTDANGECTIDRLPREEAVVRVRKDPYGECFSKVFLPGLMDDPPLVEVTLALAASVSGRVAYTNGKPASDVHVYARHGELLTSLARLVNSRVRFETQPDASGTYVLEGLGEGAYEISVHLSVTRQVLKKDGSEGTLQRWQELASRQIRVTAGEGLTGVDFEIEPTEGEGEVRGKVIDQSGEPVANAGVHVSVGDPMDFIDGPSRRMDIDRKGYFGHTTTNDQGEFYVPGLLKKKQFILTIQVEGYQHFSQRFDMTGDFVTVLLKSQGSVRGAVISKETQRRVGGARVRFLGPGFDLHGPPKVVSSDEDGSFFMENLEPGTYVITTEAAGYLRAHGPRITVKPGEITDSVLIELESGVEFSGVLVDTDQNPVAGASIGLQSKLPIEPGRIRRFSTADCVASQEDGSFQIHDMPPNGDVLLIAHDHFARRKLRVTPDMIEKGPATIVLTAGGAIEGVVLDSEGRPVQKAYINVMNEIPLESSFFDYRSIATDENGQYRFEHLPSMLFMVVKTGSMPSQRDQESKHVLVKEGEVVRVDFGHGEGAIIRGIVYKDDSPVPGALIKLSKQTEDSALRFPSFRLFTVSRDDGSYVFKGVPEGEVEIIFTAQRPGALQRMYSIFEGVARLTVSGEQREYNVDLYAQSYEILGVVRDAVTGERVPDVLIRPLVNRKGRHPSGGSAVTDSEGGFSLKPRRPGLHPYQAIKEGYAIEPFSVDVQPPQEPGTPCQFPVDVRISQTDTCIEAHLFFEGKPLVARHAFFNAFIDDMRYELRSKADPERPGVYLITGVPEGSMDLRASASHRTQFLMGYELPVTLEKGQKAVVFVNLYEMIEYQIDLQPSDGVTIQRKIDVELPDFPEATVQPRWGIGNRVELFIPAGRHPVRLAVPGYREVEFFPMELARFESGPNEGFLTLELARE